MATQKQAGQAPLEELRQLVQRGDPAATTRARNLLFDVRRGTREVDGAQALELARIGLQLGLLEDVVAWARLALERDLDVDRRVDANTLVITALYQQSRFAEALEAVRSILDLSAEGSTDARVRLEIASAQVEEKMGLLSEALDRYTAVDRWATEMDGELRTALECARGSTLNALDRHEEAVIAYERAIELSSPPDPEVLLNLGNALRDLKRYDEAERRYREAAEAASGNPVIQGSLLSNHARLLAAQGHVGDAKTMLKDAFEMRKALDPAGAAISAEELAKLFSLESDYESAAIWAHTAIDLRRSAGQPDDEGLAGFASDMSGIVGVLEQRPDIAAITLLERLRTVTPGEWQVILSAVAEEAIRQTAERLSGELATNAEADSGRAVEDRWLLTFLKRIVAVGRHLAYAEQSERMADVDQTIKAVLDLLSAEHWVARKRRYEARRAILERPLSLEVMQVMQGRAVELDVDPADVSGLRQLVERCVAMGVDAAFAELPEAYPGELINRFVMVGTWGESLQLVQAHPELSSNATIALLNQALDVSEPSQRERLAQHIDVLRRCSVVGPARAFAEAPTLEGMPLGTKIAIDPHGRRAVSDDDLAEAKAIVAVMTQANDQELLGLAELVLHEAELSRALWVLADEGESDPAKLELAARSFIRAGRSGEANTVLQRLGHAWLSRTDGDRTTALRAAVDAFRQALQGPVPPDEPTLGDLWLGLATALWELWHIDGGIIPTLLEAKDAFEEALRASPIDRAPIRAREAARGVHDTANAYLATSPPRSEAVLVRQVKIRACRAAIAATDQIIIGGGADDSANELAGTLWAYQGAVEELCALGFYGAALAAAEHGRARGFLAEIGPFPAPAASKEPKALAGLDRMRRAALPDAEELTAFLVDRDPGVVVLAWYATARDCYAFVLHGGSRKVQGMATELGTPRLAAFGQLAADSIWQRPSRPDEPFSPAWHALMDSLVPPVWREVLSNAEEIILVPHGVLASLPLHALPIRWMGGRCLLDTARVQYLPGVAVAHRLRGRVASGDVALVIAHGGEPIFEGAESEFEREARLVAATVGSDHLYLGPQGRAAPLFEFGQRASLIHIAAHARFDDSDPLGSGLFLSDGTSDGTERLSVRDVMRLPELPGSVVVLSGCETSRHSADLTGESYGLVRAFLVAGARSVVASQWRVDSPSTRILMERFHSALHTTSDVAGSLRTAALTLRDSPETNHPYYWAAFVAVGALCDQ